MVCSCFTNSMYSPLEPTPTLALLSKTSVRLRQAQKFANGVVFKNRLQPDRTGECCCLTSVLWVLAFVLRWISQQTCPKSVSNRNCLFHGDFPQQTSNNEKLFRMYFFLETFTAPLPLPYCDSKVATYPLTSWSFLWTHP